MKRSKVLLSIILVLSILVVSILPALAESVTALDEDVTISLDGKISTNLMKIIEKAENNELIPLYIQLSSIDQSLINQKLSKEYGIDVEQYDNKERYYREVVPYLFVDNKRINEIIEPSLINSYSLCLDTEDSSIDFKIKKLINQTILDNQDNYLRCYRKCIRKQINAYKTQFISDYNGKIKNTVETYSVECIIAQVEKKNIYQLALDDRVESIDYYVNATFENASWSSASVTESDSITGLGSSYYNDGDGFDGTGIKIGIVEAANGRFDPNDYNLSDLVASGKLSFVQNPYCPAAQIDLHATSVTTLICGKKTIIEGKTYEGVAKGATVYQINITDNNSIPCALNELISNYNVDVINMSLGIPPPLSSYDSYDDTYDSYIDNLINNNKVSIVAAAGNNWGYVQSPAKAYRTIAVGAIDAKAPNNTILSAPYSIASYSNYILASTTANKPDVVAPGSYIRIPYDAISIRKVAGSSGTSYAAPIATGIVAQIMQAQPYAVSSPLAAKTYLLCGASNNSLTGTTTVCGALKNESGAGLVNAVHSIGYNYSYNYATEFFGLYGTILEGFDYDIYSTAYSINLSEGQHVRIALVFDTKPYDHYQGKDNMDLRLVLNDNPSVSLIASAESEYNNVELIDIVAPTNGTYSIQTRLAEHVFDHVPNTELRYWLAWRKYYS